MPVKRNILNTKDQTALNNFLVSKMYLEYSSFLLSDLEYFIMYTDISVKASKFSQVEKRFDEIQKLISKSKYHYLSCNIYFREQFQLLFDYVNWFYDLTLEEFNKGFIAEEESGFIEKDSLDLMTTSINFYNSYMAFLPVDHYEFLMYESAKQSNKAFVDCFIPGESIYSANTQLSMEFTELALDFLERAYQSIDQGAYIKNDYDALTINLESRNEDYLSFKDYQELKKTYVCTCYQENVLMKQLFLVISFSVDENTSGDKLHDLAKTTDLIYQTIPDFVAMRNESALNMFRSNLILSNQKIDNHELFFPSKEFSKIFESNSYNYLKNLPKKLAS